MRGKFERPLNWFKRDAVNDGKGAFDCINLGGIDTKSYLKYRHGEPHPDRRVTRSRRKYVKYFLKGLRRTMMRYVENLKHVGELGDDSVMTIDRRKFKNSQMCEHCNLFYQRSENYCSRCGRELL